MEKTCTPGDGSTTQALLPYGHCIFKPEHGRSPCLDRGYPHQRGDFGGRLTNVFDFGDFDVSFAATVAGRYTRRGDSRLSVQCEPLIVLTRES